MSLVEAVNEGWGWTGLTATRVVAQSPMGHLIVANADETLFYLDPDGMAIIPLGTEAEAQAHLASDEAKQLWSGGALVEEGKKLFGEPPVGSVFTIKPHAMIEGRYEPENLCVMPLDELIRFTGDVAQQIKELPDGSQIQFEVTD
ncbi:hypothetical protein [Erythrobacter sp.]|uniref:hypothetical protein n=1 Tax=Erythrobacter sp. TaxID=1042 RepID=UPI0025EE0AF2|nr:hypothetical protein [Erythrobacter sp.]